jgi:hypothetical protein
MSLRWLLVVVALLSLLFYLFFVRPTVIATRFMAVVKRGDYKTAESLVHGTDRRFLTGIIEELEQPVIVDVELVPQYWQSLFSGKRIIAIEAISNPLPADSCAAHIAHNGYQMQVSADMFGVHLVSKAFARFNTNYVDELERRKSHAQ